MKNIVAFLLLFFLLNLTAKAQGVRRLLIFAKDNQDADLLIQRQWIMADSAGIERRGIWLAIFTDPRTFRRMYEYHGAERNTFSLIFIEGDGREKFRSEKPVPVAVLFEKIDGDR